MIALIDYGSGNIRSVTNALRREQADVELVSDPARLEDAAAIVLPGVGAFGDCVRGLQSRGLWDPVAAWLAADKPFLGICVGYQMLFDSSEESPEARGFGFFPGAVKRFPAGALKVPQIGWNRLELVNPAAPLWAGLPQDPYVYFVHSFYPQPLDPTVTAAHCTYGSPFAAAAQRGRTSAVQFHPEKSQTVGLRILRNFISSVS